MEEAVRAGKVRSIGLSNFSAAKVREVLDVAAINALPQKAYYEVSDEAPAWVLAKTDVDAAQA